MKFITYLLALVSAVSALRRPEVLSIRGGASVGPVDADLVSKVGKASLALYVGGSASKWVAGQTGGKAPEITDACTNDIVSTVAFVDAVATAAYFIGDSGFASDKMAAVLMGAVLVQKALSAGGIDKIFDVVKANIALSVLFVLMAVVTFA